MAVIRTSGANFRTERMESEIFVSAKGRAFVPRRIGAMKICSSSTSCFSRNWVKISWPPSTRMEVMFFLCKEFRTFSML